MPLTRRQFLRGNLGLAALAGTAHGRQEHALLTRHGLAFGTRIAVTVAGLPSDHANAALDAAFGTIRDVESATGLYQRGGPLWRLNSQGAAAWHGAPGLLLQRLLAEALRWAEMTEGAFDPTIQPLWQAHFAAMTTGQPLAGRALERVRALAGWQGVRMDARGVRLAREGMRLTLNGLAQGFAADRAWEALAAQGVRNALVNAGEWRAAGAAAGLRPWRIGLRPAMGAQQDVALRDAAVASSGNDGLRFSADGRLYHILDPRTGLSPAELVAAHVIAPDACSADALSTACMVLGRQRALALVESLPQVRACLLDREGRTWASRDWSAWG